MTSSASDIQYVQAESAELIEQIHRLNHDVFAVEIRQHAVRADRRLIDKFHDKNSYFVALDNGDVVGLVSTHWTRPFSIEERCPGFGEKIPLDARVAEIRLLAVRRDYRRSGVFWGLVATVAEFLLKAGFEVAVISALSERQSMYERLGFEALGDATSSGEASFVPMFIARECFQQFWATKRI